VNYLSIPFAQKFVFVFSGFGNISEAMLHDVRGRIRELPVRVFTTKHPIDT
jgi:hypothetical protein